MGLAMLWLIAAVGVMLGHPTMLFQPHFSPQVVSLTHAWMLGFFATVACGAVYQLVPVALSTTLWNETFGWLHFWLHGLGVPGMVISFWFNRYDLVGWFGGIVIVGVILFSVNAIRTVLGSKRRDVIAIGILIAAIWLLITVFAGLFLIANRLWGWVPLNPIALLRAHAHLGLIGFFLTLIQGVGFQLVPMFTMGQVKNWGPAKAGVWCTQIGLLLLIPGLVMENTILEVIATTVIAVGLGFSAVGIKQAMKDRRKKRIDPGVVVFLRGCIGICVAAIVAIFLAIYGSTRADAFSGFNAMTYAILAIFGGLLPCVTGMMCKVVPFLTWMRAYGPWVGKRYTPPAHTMTNAKLELWGLGLQQFSALPMVVGAWIVGKYWLIAGIGMLTVGVILFLIDMARVLRHLWKPDTTPLVIPGAKANTN